MSEPVDLYIELAGKRFVLAFKDGELPESVAGRENVHKVRFVNNTDFNLSSIKIASPLPNIRAEYPDTLRAKTTKEGTITIELSDEVEGAFADIPLVIQCEARGA